MLSLDENWAQIQRKLVEASLKICFLILSAFPVLNVTFEVSSNVLGTIGGTENDFRKE